MASSKKFVIFILSFASLLWIFGTVYFAKKELSFISNSSLSVANIEEVNPRNDMCRGKGKNSTDYECTRFDAIITYKDQKGQSLSSNISAGDVGGLNKDIRYASYSKGDAVEIYYSNLNPKEIKLNSFFDLYLFTFVFGVNSIVFPIVTILYYYFK